MRVDCSRWFPLQSYPALHRYTQFGRFRPLALPSKTHAFYLRSLRRHSICTNPLQILAAQREITATTSHGVPGCCTCVSHVLRPFGWRAIMRTGCCSPQFNSPALTTHGAVGSIFIFEAWRCNTEFSWVLSISAKHSTTAEVA